jgi:hypothetical protein
MTRPRVKKHRRPKVFYRFMVDKDKGVVLPTLLSHLELTSINAFCIAHKGHTVFTGVGTGSGIGTNVYVGCASCKISEDVTDYGAW